MKGPQQPFEPRRRKDLRAELVERAHAWLPDWRPRDDQQDFATALFEIVARLESEVTQRLDKVPDKVFRGFLQWLGVSGEPGRAARLPVVFSMTPGAEPVLAHPPIQLQATPAQTDTAVPADPITFETDVDMMVSRGSLATVVGVDPATDAFFLPHAGFSTLDLPAPRPDAWKATSDAQQGTSQVQLEPVLGLETLPTLFHGTGPTRDQYRVTTADGTLVTLDPPLKRTVAQGDRFEPASSFDPFGTSENNRQEHALYLGSAAVLNVPAAATIAIRSLGSVGSGASWWYWGKTADDDTDAWRSLAPPKLIKGDVVLSKPEGTVEITRVGDRESRWLRAVHANPVSGSGAAVSGMQLTVNCGVDDTSRPCPPPAAKRSTVAVEAIANTTPLVLDIPFFPLGREPKLFDAFYVGCPEAFSKPDASVAICLEAFDSTTHALVGGPIGDGDGAGLMLFGAGRGQLHRLVPSASTTRPLERRPSVRPPFSDNGIASVPGPSAPISEPPTGARLSRVARTDDTIVAVTAGNDGWLWLQHKQPGMSRWIPLGAIHDPKAGPLPDPDDEDPAKLAVMRDGASVLRVVGINHGRLFEARVTPESPEATTVWSAVIDAVATDWAHVVPVSDATRPGIGADLGGGWLGIRGDGSVSVFVLDGNGNSAFDATLATVQAAPSVEPIAFREPAGVVTLISKAASGLVAWSVTADTKGASVDAPDILGSIEWTSNAQTLAVLFAEERPEGGQTLATWFPFAALQAPPHPDPETGYASAPFDRAVGGPAVLGDRVTIPRANGAVLSLPFSLDGLRFADIAVEQIGSALVMASATPPGAIDDFIETTLDGGDPVVSQLTVAPTHSAGNRYWLRLPPAAIDTDFTSALLYRRRVNTEFNGTIASTISTKTVLTAEPGDEAAEETSYLVVGVGAPAARVLSIHEITHIRRNPSPWAITVKPAVKDVTKDDSVTYFHVRPGIAGTIQPLLDVTPTDPTVVAATIAGGAYLDGFEPTTNRVAFADPAQPLFTTLVLRDAWSSRPSAGVTSVTLTATALYGAATVVEDLKNANPTLSWEYWDGSAWWKIQDLNDGTGGLQQTGTVTFCVPDGLTPTDVAGRTSHWIRARLIAGDYGKESVTITSTIDATDPKISTQTIDRSLAGITPPQFVSIDLRYSVCCPAWPDYVLTRDSHAVRDQTAANSISGATIELFVPLAETIPQAASGATSSGDTRRALYLGFAEQLEGGPITVLFLVDEGEHDAAFPLEVDVLRERGFERVAASDGTRGLNETGLLSFTLPTPAPPVALFGETRYWLRVRPNDRFDAAKWRPKVRGAFLNGAWTTAAETQDQERLGSSDGSPNQRVFLARPPIVKDTLELRINEPLGDEDLDELRRRRGPSEVIDRLPNGAAGHWVRWTNVADLTEGDANARIYSLDHETGAIVFGDGQNGRIPPIAPDSIVAVRYRRGGGDAANRVTAWSQVTLISPLPGVQTVAAPEGAAGGSDPQAPESVVRFAPASLLMRGRALTLRDLETLARQFSSDVAQARATAAPRGVRIVVAMRGRDPRPSAAQRRALTQFLSERTVPMLGDRGALVIAPPRIALARFTLTLAIDAIEASGAVSRDVRARIERLLDPATGGDGGGWPLGQVPSDDDIASAIADVAHLEEVHAITIADARTGTPLTTLAIDELVALAPDGVVSRLVVAAEVEA